MSKNRPDLTTVKRLLEELEQTLSVANNVSTNPDKMEYIVEMNKATGLASGILIEASALMSDIQYFIQKVSVSSGTKNDLLEKLIGGLKGSGNTN